MQQADGWQEQHRYQPESGAMAVRSSRPEGNRPEANRPDPMTPWAGPLPAEPLPAQESHSENLASLIHDTRNMVSAMDLYCDLLEEPGVLASEFRHYAGELRLIGGASRRLMEKLATVECASALAASFAFAVGTRNSQAAFHRASKTPPAGRPESSLGRSLRDDRQRRVPEFQPMANLVANLAQELQNNRNLLSALVGPGITVGLSISGCQLPVTISRDDLTRVLVNLARNAAEAMPAGGHLQIALEQEPCSLTLSFADQGAGIPAALLETIFSPGFSTRVGPQSRIGSDSESRRESRSDLVAVPVTVSGTVPGTVPEPQAWPIRHRGLGLSIVRSIVSAAGGVAWARNRADEPSFAVLTLAQGDSSLSMESSTQSLTESPSTDCAAHSGAVITIEFPLPNAAVAS
jgi:signal transduction histidine kinase